jgi:hypothetical protein
VRHSGADEKLLLAERRARRPDYAIQICCKHSADVDLAPVLAVGEIEIEFMIGTGEY